MKNKIAIVLLFALVATARSAIAQELRYDSTAGRWVYREVITLDSAHSKDAIFEKARAWMVRNYQSAKKTLEVEDKEGGQIMTNGRKKNFGVGYDMLYNHTIECKDGRVRVTFSDFATLVTLRVDYASDLAPTAWEDIKKDNNYRRKLFQKAQEYCAALCDDLEKHLRSAAKTDGW